MIGHWFAAWTGFCICWALLGELYQWPVYFLAWVMGMLVIGGIGYIFEDKNG